MTLLDEIEAAIPSLRRYAHALLRDREGADDLVQDCLERALARRHHWRGDGPVRAWMFRILLNQFRDNMRRASARAYLVPLDAALEPASAGGQEAHLHLREVHEAMGRMPPDQRAALLLVALEGMSFTEAAEALNVPEGTLASRLGRARAFLRHETNRPYDNSKTKKETPL